MKVVKSVFFGGLLVQTEDGEQAVTQPRNSDSTSGSISRLTEICFSLGVISTQIGANEILAEAFDQGVRAIQGQLANNKEVGDSLSNDAEKRIHAMVGDYLRNLGVPKQ